MKNPHLFISRGGKRIAFLLGAILYIESAPLIALRVIPSVRAPSSAIDWVGFTGITALLGGVVAGVGFACLMAGRMLYNWIDEGFYKDAPKLERIRQEYQKAQGARAAEIRGGLSQATNPASAGALSKPEGRDG
jgi:hypothetical protein